MTILVTTPNGKVGSFVVEGLLTAGFPVRVAAYTVEKAQKAFPNAEEIVPFDFADETSVQNAVQGIEALYLAGPGPLEAAPRKRVVDLAKAAGVQRVVMLSAIGVEQGDSPLRQAEKHIETSGLAWTHLRPTWFMQNFSTGGAVESIKQGILADPAGEGTTGFIDTRDIAAVAIKALTEDGHAGQAYTLTGAESLSWTQAAEQIAAAIGRPVQYKALSDEEFRAQVIQHLPPAYVETLSLLYGFVRENWMATLTENVAQILGRPPISFSQFAQDHRAVWL